MSVFRQVNALRQELSGRIVGQEKLVDRMLMALLTDGHLLVEGAPGLAKTRAIRELSSMVEGDYQRIQFTPDLLPADITGTEIYRPADGSFAFQQGPLFNNLILADEINRAPAKVQSALLEAMAEQQISVGQKTYPLPPLFMVMATQNPIEQEGTYPLPEAQLDRFLMHVLVDYPDASKEVEILRLVRDEQIQAGNHSATVSVDTTAPLGMETLFAARREVLALHMSEDVENYMVRLVTTTRDAAGISEQMKRWIAYGASPRGTLALDACARAHAWLDESDYVSPGDVQAVLHDVLRHRILLSYEAEAEDVTTDQVVDQLLDTVAVP
ncbi:MAG: AAA family ATPase [Gammaproteobacteria bacterium]|nr:AAA family ATPase [Gammaproteobacteria bacterium]